MAPTFEISGEFTRDWKKLSEEPRRRFIAAKDRFVEDLKSDHEVRPGLRIKAVQGEDGVYEFTFAPDGRATFQFGEEVIEGEVHVVWRRVGTHEVLDQP